MGTINQKGLYDKDADSIIYISKFRLLASIFAVLIPSSALIEIWLSGYYFNNASLAYNQKISYALMFFLLPATFATIIWFERFYNVLHSSRYFNIKEYINTDKKLFDLWWSHFSETTRIFLFMAISAALATSFNPSLWWCILWIGITLTLAGFLNIIFTIKYAYGFVKISETLGNERDRGQSYKNTVVIGSIMSLLIINGLAFWALGSISISKIANYYV